MELPIQQVKNILESMPVDSSYEEILKEITFNKMVQRGLEDSINNRIITNEEMLKNIKQW